MRKSIVSWSVLSCLLVCVSTAPVLAAATGEKSPEAPKATAAEATAPEAKVEEQPPLEKVPTFALTTTTGETFDLQSRKGQTLTAVVFFATWSPKSEKVLSILAKTKEKYGDKGFDIIAINAESEEPPAGFATTLADYLTKVEINYTVALDAGLATFSAWSIKALPSIALLNAGLEQLYFTAGAPTSFEPTFTKEVEKGLGIFKEEVSEETAPTRYHAAKPQTRGFAISLKLTQRGRATKGLKKINKVIKDDPNFPDAHVLRAMILLSLKKMTEEDFKSAGGSVDKALELDPNLPMAMIAKAGFILSDGETTKAIELVRNALGKSAWGFFKKPGEEEAKEIMAKLDKAASLPPESEEAMVGVGEVVEEFLVLRKKTKVKMKTQ